MRSDGGRPAAVRHPAGTLGHLHCPRVASIWRGCGLQVWVSALLAPCLQRHHPTALLSALGAGCRSSECRGAGAGPGRRNTTAGGLESVSRPPQPTLAAVGRRGLGAVQRPPAPAALQTHFSRLPRRPAAQPTSPLEPQGSIYPRGWFDRTHPRQPPPHHHIAPHSTHTSLSLALPETLPQIEPEPPTSEETQCR